MLSPPSCACTQSHQDITPLFKPKQTSPLRSYGSLEQLKSPAQLPFGTQIPIAFLSRGAACIEPEGQARTQPQGERNEQLSGWFERPNEEA